MLQLAVVDSTRSLKTSSRKYSFDNYTSNISKNHSIDLKGTTKAQKLT